MLFVERLHQSECYHLVVMWCKICSMLYCFFVLCYYLTEKIRLLNKDCFFGKSAYFAENSVPLSLYRNHGNQRDSLTHESALNEVDILKKFEMRNASGEDRVVGCIWRGPSCWVHLERTKWLDTSVEDQVVGYIWRGPSGWVHLERTRLLGASGKDQVVGCIWRGPSGWVHLERTKWLGASGKDQVVGYICRGPSCWIHLERTKWLGTSGEDQVVGCIWKGPSCWVHLERTKCLGASGEDQVVGCIWRVPSGWEHLESTKWLGASGEDQVVGCFIQDNKTYSYVTDWNFFRLSSHNFRRRTLSLIRGKLRACVNCNSKRCEKKS
jgi:hypothetical protein